MHHTNKKTIKCQNRNKNTTERFTQTYRGFLFYCFRSTCVTNVGNSLRSSTISLDTWKPTFNLLKPIPAISAEKNLAVLIPRNAEESHNYTITCPVCGHFFNRRENVLRYRALHERPEVRPRMLVKRPASPEPGPSNSPA
jgi:hypothetical protein